MWNLKTNVIPLITETTESISKSFRKYLSNIPGKQEIKDLQGQSTHTSECTKDLTLKIALCAA
jgi:hypothetical protein